MSITELPSAGTEMYSEGLARVEETRKRTAAEEADREVARKLKEADAAPKIAAAEAKKARILEQERKEKARREEAERAEQQRKARIERAAKRWRKAAMAFAVICGVVALPLQILAFYSPHAPFLVVAPLVLEGGAWVLLAGAAAAIEEDRPTWHYRTVAGLAAAFAAWINWSHGHEVFGAATGAAGAFCSLAGPAVWDLHEHGRIAKKSGKVSWSQRRRQKAEAKRQADARASRERAEAQRKEQARREEVERYQTVAAAREEAWPQVWKHAQQLAAALGETRISDPVWRRAWFDIWGTDIGDTPETIAARVAARAQAMRSATTPAGAEEPTEDGSFVDGAEPLSTGTSKTASPLGRKGIQRSAGTSQKAPDRPLTEDELNRVRALADDLGDAAKLSVKKVSAVVGGGSNEHLKRLRDAVQAERGASLPTTAAAGAGGAR